MADAEQIIIVEGSWQLLAAAILSGLFHKKNNAPTGYYFTSKDAGNDAPISTNPSDDGVPLFLTGNTIEAKADNPKDFYVFCTGKNGEIMVEV